MSMVPSFMLKKLYKKSSLRNGENGLEFTLENTLSTARLTSLDKVVVDGTEYAADKVQVLVNGETKTASDFSQDNPLVFNKAEQFTVRIAGVQVDPATSHMVVLQAKAVGLGDLKIEIGDTISAN